MKIFYYFSNQNKMNLEELIKLTDIWGWRIKNLNPDRGIDPDKIAEDIDDFLIWAFKQSKSKPKQETK